MVRQSLRRRRKCGFARALVRTALTHDGERLHEGESLINGLKFRVGPTVEEWEGD